jgi:hypothetical protein
VERALYNTVLAGINADGRRYFYVNPLEVWPNGCLPSTAMAHVKPVRQEWFSVACCPTNVARTLASLGQYIYAEDDRTLYVHQFISSSVSTDLNGSSVTLSMDADIVHGGLVRFNTDGRFRLCVRIPHYADQPVFHLNGRAAEPFLEKGYAVFDLDGASKVLMNLNVEPRWAAANDRVTADAGKAALLLGPFVYCLEETDNEGNLPAISVSPDTRVERSGTFGDLPGVMPRLVYAGYRSSSGVESLYGRPVFDVRPARLTAVPYCLWCNRSPGEMLVWQRVRI